MPAPSTATEEPAEVIPGGLRFVSTMLFPSPDKEDDHVYLHLRDARV